MSEQPPNVDFNPSKFSERGAVLLFAALGFVLASYLALYQSGILSGVWEPFFGSGSERVLHSSISRLFPVPDAWLGALGYVADFVTGALGGSKRWRTAPKLVLLYGAVVAAVAATALVLAILQPVVVHAGCSLCLTSAAISLVIAWLACHEVLAAWHRLYEKRKTK
ncbi:MAG: vitamin K epoxide reductase family protein [Chthoniobacterales bacterium]